MKKFAVFDIDGTLIRWQLYHAAVDKLAKQGKLGADAHDKIHAARMRWKNREANYGFSDYEHELIGYFEDALLQLNPQEINEVVEQVITEYRDQSYVYTKNLMAKLREEGYMLLAISGSQQELVQHIARHYGFDDWIGTVYKTDGEKYTGKKIVGSYNKAASLKKLIEKHNLSMAESYAVGDSKSDAPMLEMVENPIAFNPDKELFKVAKEKQWSIVVERKNMTYRLEYRDGRYILAETN